MTWFEIILALAIAWPIAYGITWLMGKFMFRGH